MKLLIATQNPGKKKEFVKLFEESSIEFLLPTELESGPFTYPEETGVTFVENAFIKAKSLYDQTHLPTLADDSGLSVVALNGFPGVQSARWMKGTGSDRVSGLLKKLEGRTDRSAFFTCVLCLITPEDTEPHYFEGTWEGSISHEPRGTEGFDYDVIFIPKGETKTSAELGTEYKNSVSHRARALEKLRVFLEKKYAKLGNS